MIKRKTWYTEEKGFTLVEVLASIVIISVILLGVVNLFTFTNKTAISNNNKLVTTHLAKATIERIKIQPNTYFSFNNITSEEISYTKNNCKPTNCTGLYQFNVNDELYNVTVTVSQTNRQSIKEEELGLVNIVVEVKHDEKKLKSTVEGYVIDETP